MFLRGVSCGALLLALLVVSEGSLFAYARELNAAPERGGVPLAWRRGCVFIQLPPTGPKGLPIDAVLAAVERSGHNWTEAAEARCNSYLRFVFERSAEPLVARRDLRNSVIWYEDVSKSVALRQNPDAPAITTITSIRLAQEPVAQIIDADTELNDESSVFRWGIIDPNNPDLDAYDIENTMVHEFGHSLGLGHSCFDGRADSNPTDNNGQRLPSCPTSGPASATTMYFSELPGETMKRSPEDDEIQGICDMYPAASPPPACIPLFDNSELVSTMGCAMAPASTTSGDGIPLSFMMTMGAKPTAQKRRDLVKTTTFWLMIGAGLAALHLVCRKKKTGYSHDEDAH